MTILADHISVLGRFTRSANLERDIDRPEPLDGYIVTARALDVVERVAAVAASGPAGGAWSLTGPYGSGKSSLALLLDAAFGPATPTRTLAWRLIDETSPAVGELIRQAHGRHHTKDSGFHRGLITANREPIGHTVLRALHSAVLRRYGKLPSSGTFQAADTLSRALEDATTNDPRRTGPSATATVEIARCLAEDAPLLLIIDEFGKNLEAIGDSTEADPYLLQQLAEAGQGSGLPIFLLTLQHLSFEDYLAGTGGHRRREWAKVQGRFEDISYVESARQTRALIGTAFVVRDENLQNRISRWAQPHAKAMRSLGIPEMADPEVVASCYPLHPLAAMLLPELCSRYGQHERTLFSFLAGLHSASAASFLATTKLPSRGSLPSLGLAAVYDYFVASETQAAMSSERMRRWTEIALRLRDLHGLTPQQTRLAKAIALLNLVSAGGTVRASSEVLSLADPDSGATLAGLETAGVVIYREFANEYRIWQGTDVDIRRLMELAHQRVKQQSLPEILSGLDQPLPVVAARHSAEHDVLRVFTRRYAAGGEHIEPLNAFSPYDGEILLIVSVDRGLPKLANPAATAQAGRGRSSERFDRAPQSRRRSRGRHRRVEGSGRRVRLGGSARARRATGRDTGRPSTRDLRHVWCRRMSVGPDRRFRREGASRRAGQRCVVGGSGPCVFVHPGGRQRNAQPYRPHLAGRQGPTPPARGHDRARLRGEPRARRLRSGSGHVSRIPGTDRTPWP